MLEKVPAGYPVTNLPAQDAHLGYSHTWRFAQGGSLEALVNSHISGTFWTVAASRDMYDKQSSYTQTDLSLRYVSPKGITLTGYARNIENVVVTTYGENPGFHLYVPGAPRTYGMTVSYKFQ